MIHVGASRGLFVYPLCWCVARHFFGRRGATVQSFRATPTLVAICTLSRGAPSASTLPMISSERPEPWTGACRSALCRVPGRSYGRDGLSFVSGAPHPTTDCPSTEVNS
jgi:hypothetical protein